jgi:transcriptional regulator of acetoin/glycerol metabolism
MIDTATGFHTRTGMFDDWLDQRATMRAWEDFLTFRDPTRSQTSGVRREILESWGRSLDFGIDAAAQIAPETAGARDGIELPRHAELRAAAEVPFAKIGPLLSEANALLILTDAEGLILDQIGDIRTRDAAHDIRLIRGGRWGETTMGTNAIGTAIRTGRPTVVHASEHFCRNVKSWTCAAAPIHDPVDRQLIGIVDLSGPPGIFRPHNVAMIAAVAREIEANLEDRQEAQKALLLEAFFESGPAAGSSDAVVILDQIGRVMYHRSPAARTLEVKPTDLALGRQLIALSDRMSDHDIARAMPPHIRPTGVSRLLLDGKFCGAALVLPSAERPQRVPMAAPGAAAVRIPARQGASGDELLMVGRAPRFLEAVDLARRAAEAGASVLIQGETGTGKELFARLVHSGGARKGKGPFVTVNCGAISAELFGSELFGHVSGAFTGASRDGKPGKFEQADGGVLCLDEIGEMPLDLQPYLLRVLEQRAVYRIGCSRRRQVNVQLIAMTNRDLETEIEAGRFRRDLYYRIGTVTIEVPPVRERRSDIPLLAEHFNATIAARNGRQPLVIAPDAMDRLCAHSWPGNVREMRNLFERLHLLASGQVVTEADLPAALRQPDRSPPGAEALPAAEAEPASLTDMEARAIRRALVAEEGNLTRVAAALGISRPTLYRKLRAYGIRRTFE